MNNDVHYTLMNEIVLKDPYIMAFYEKYPYIDCTQLNKSMIIFLEQVLERNETKQDTSIIEKMFHKLMSIENYLQNDDPQSKSVSTMLKQELNHTKSSTLDAITAATRSFFIKIKMMPFNIHYNPYSKPYQLLLTINSKYYTPILFSLCAIQSMKLKHV